MNKKERDKLRAIIGERIRDRRAELGMKQYTLARKVRCDNAVISRIESGVTSVTVERLVDVARALGVDYVDFLPESTGRTP